MRKCDTPYCNKLIPQGRLKRLIGGYYFCMECRAAHSYRVLIAQADHQMPIREVLLDASVFGSAGDMAAYIGVSFVTVYHWITRYFGLTFQEFRRQYICKKASRNQCYLLDIERSSYSRHDYVLKKIRSKRYCACINAVESNLIMTNAPLTVIQSIWRGSPRIQKISDDLFALVPSPIKFLNLFPIYLDRDSEDGVWKAPRIKTGVQVLKGPCFSDKVLVALLRMGGEAGVEDLCKNLTNSYGVPPRKNNTRREAYRHPDQIEMVPGNDQRLRLTEKGKESATRLMADQ